MFVRKTNSFLSNVTTRLYKGELFMSSLGNTLNEKVIPVIMKFVNLKGIIALKDGILYTLPIIMVGSVFLLLAQIPYAPFNDWMASMLSSL